jgi:hypothetical protein
MCGSGSAWAVPPPTASSRAIAVLAAATTRIDIIGSFLEKLIVVDRVAT